MYVGLVEDLYKDTTSLTTKFSKGAVRKSQSSLVTCDLSTKNKKIRQKSQT